MCVCVNEYLTFSENRIQSDYLPAIAPILEALIRRVESHAQPKIHISNSSALPISSLITLVDAHYKSYQNVQIIRVSSHLILSNSRLNLVYILPILLAFFFLLDFY